MKVVMGVPWYFPNSIGGMEVYVASLAEQLRKLDITSVVAVPDIDGKGTTLSHKNIRVVHYPSPGKHLPSRSILDSVNADEFCEWLKTEQPDVYHQHDWTLNCGLTNLRAAKENGIPTVITIHLPKLVCRLGTMMYENSSPCDGRILEHRCARCFLRARGVPASVAEGIGRIPSNLAVRLSNLPLLGELFSGQGTARNFANGLQLVAETVDLFVTHSLWLKQALLINGVPASKVLYGRLGVDPEGASAFMGVARSSSSALRIGFLARANYVKGLHVLIAALLRLPKNMKFTFCGMVISEPPASDDYLQGIQKLIAGQPNFRLYLDQPRSAVHAFFQNIDVLAVPSQWLETGPLVVLEANAWKVPVVGSNLGGISELIRHDIDGILVPPADIAGWTSAFSNLASDPTLLPRLKDNIPQVRTMEQIAREMRDVYRSVARDQK